jgi:glycosyltransferase involved in cell wall biosynthesis
MPQAAWMKANLSVLVPAGNEEHNIVACLESVRWADDVVLVDSLSTDRTVELARPLADRVLQREYGNSASQKNWAIPQMGREWVLVVDADERVTPELRAEIEAIVAKPWKEGEPVAYRIWRDNHFLGKPVRFCGWQNDSVVRLFRRDKCRYQERHVHADIVAEGSTSKLKGRLKHFTFRSFDQYMAKFDRYTSWAANDRAKRTKRARWHHLTLRPLARFLKQYVLKQGFRDGMTGLIICKLAAHSVFMKYAKLWEMERLGKLPGAPGSDDAAKPSARSETVDVEPAPPSNPMP